MAGFLPEMWVWEVIAKLQVTTFFLLPWKMTVSEERTLQTVHAYSRPNSSLKCSILIFGRVLIARGWGEGNVGESNSNAHRAENGSLQSLLPIWRLQAYSPAKERAKFTRNLPNCKKTVSHLTAKCYNFFAQQAQTVLTVLTNNTVLLLSTEWDLSTPVGKHKWGAGSPQYSCQHGHWFHWYFLQEEGDHWFRPQFSLCFSHSSFVEEQNILISKFSSSFSFIFLHKHIWYEHDLMWGDKL